MTGPTVVLARHGGTCPLCSRFIVKSRSRIVGLPIDMPPSLDAVFFDAERGYWRERRGDGRQTRIVRRTWAHAKCVRGASNDELIALADRRNRELQEHRDRALGRHGGTR